MQLKLREAARRDPSDGDWNSKVGGANPVQVKLGMEKVQGCLVS